MLISFQINKISVTLNYEQAIKLIEQFDYSKWYTYGLIGWNITSSSFINENQLNIKFFNSDELYIVISRSQFNASLLTLVDLLMEITEEFCKQQNLPRPFYVN